MGVEAAEDISIPGFVGQNHDAFALFLAPKGRKNGDFGHLP